MGTAKGTTVESLGASYRMAIRTVAIRELKRVWRSPQEQSFRNADVARAQRILRETPTMFKALYRLIVDAYDLHDRKALTLFLGLNGSIRGLPRGAPGERAHQVLERIIDASISGALNQEDQHRLRFLITKATSQKLVPLLNELRTAIESEAKKTLGGDDRSETLEMEGRRGNRTRRINDDWARLVTELTGSGLTDYKAYKLIAHETATTWTAVEHGVGLKNALDGCEDIFNLRDYAERVPLTRKQFMELWRSKQIAPDTPIKDRRAVLMVRIKAAAHRRAASPGP